LSNAQKFQYIISGIREDLTFVENLYWALWGVLYFNQELRSSFSSERKALEIREWIYDVLLDKIYEIDSKILRFLTDVSQQGLYKKLSIQEMKKYTIDIVQGRNPYENLDKLKRAIGNYRNSVDVTMDDVRKAMYETNWVGMEKISIEDYVFHTERRRYVTAREELEKARQAIKGGQWEDVFNRLRPAIDLAIKDKYGFNDIHMKPFLDYSREHNELKLPSIDLLYLIFDEGSGRLHGGKIHTPLECQTALEFVARFIDQLDLIAISKEEIESFKQKCKFVK